MNKDKNQPLLSVIVPVYNTEKFIRKCLDSIVGQTYRNIEIIIVNDGSLENENQIIKEYLETDDRIRVIQHPENKGLFQARITGMEAAKGEYFTFVDSDDSISIDYYRLLIKKAIETDSDMVIADFANEYEDGRQEYYNLDPIRLQDLNLEGEKVLETFMKQQGLFFGWHTVWNKIYSIDLWEQGKKYLKAFSEEVGHLVMTEDIAFSCVFWSLARKVTNVHNVYYFYARHNGQSVASGSLSKFEKNVKNVSKVFDFFGNTLIELGNWERFENEYESWRKLFVKHWCAYICKLNEDDAQKAELLVKNLFDINTIFKIEKDDDFFYQLSTNFRDEFSWYETIKKMIIREENKYVSFDIFDTLILRPFFDPKDLFKFLDFEINKILDLSVYIDFAEIRMKAEDSARKILNIENPSFEDLTLDEIYKYIKDNYTFDDNTIDYMKQREIELEVEFCTQRNNGKELYELAKYYNKKILFISDMYLPEDTVKQILIKNGYEGKLFLSSEIRLLKWTNNLYKHVLKELIIEADEIIHIGDNWQTDIISAQNEGIRSFHLPKLIEQFTGINPGIYSGKSFDKIFKANGNAYNYDVKADSLFLGIRCMCALAANKIFDNPYMPFNKNSDFNANPYYIGYYALGLHLYAVTNWLIENIKDKNASTLHFIARDGYLPLKAYEILAPADAPKSNYLYFTRKSILPVSIGEEDGIYSLLKMMRFDTMSPEKFINLIDCVIKKEILEDEDIANLCKKRGFVFSKKFPTSDLFVKFINFCKKELIDWEAIKNYKEKFVNFAAEAIKENDVLFDLGYSGRNELLLSKVLGYPVDCFYIHTNSDDCSFRSELGNFKINTFYDFRPVSCAIIREHLFSKLEPSCIGFDMNGNEFTPVFEKYNHNYQTDIITEIMQNAALDFVRDMRDIFGKYENCIAYKDLCASMPYEFFINCSNEFDMRIFDASYFEDEVHGGDRDINFFDFWKNNRITEIENPVEKIIEIPVEVEKVIEIEKIIEVEKIVEVKVPLDYAEFLEGKPKWKKAAFMWLFDKKLFKENASKKFKK